jgi:hypothetical protein
MRNSVREAGPDGSVCVEARGMVSITGRDEAEARDAALSAAKQDAIGQVVGFRTRTVFSQVGQELDQQASVSHGKGYIQSFRINVDVRRGDIYVVEIEACVSLRELDKQIGDAMKALGRPKIVVECPAGHLRTKIEAELDAARIPVTKDEGLASYLVRADLSYEEYSRKLGTQERAATRLNSILVLVDRDTRETACHASLPEVRSFLGGADERRRDCQRQLVAAPAPADAAESEAQESPQEQLEQFLGCVRDEFRRLADEGRPVFIEISHPRAANDPVATLLRGLKNLPGATAIEQELYSDTSASMQLRFLGESRWLAEILQREFDDIAADAGYRLKRKEVTPRVVRLSVDTP